jgi:hypothetical protein
MNTSPHSLSGPFDSCFQLRLHPACSLHDCPQRLRQILLDIEMRYESRPAQRVYLSQFWHRKDGPHVPGSGRASRTEHGLSTTHILICSFQDFCLRVRCHTYLPYFSRLCKRHYLNQTSGEAVAIHIPRLTQQSKNKKEPVTPFALLRTFIRKV